MKIFTVFMEQALHTKAKHHNIVVLNSPFEATDINQRITAK